MKHTIIIDLIISSILIFLNSSLCSWLLVCCWSSQSVRLLQQYVLPEYVRCLPCWICLPFRECVTYHMCRWFLHEPVSTLTYFRICSFFHSASSIFVFFFYFYLFLPYYIQTNYLMLVLCLIFYWYS